VVAVPTEGDDGVSTIYIEVEATPGAGAGWDGDETRDRTAARAVAVARDILDDGVELARSCARRFTEGLKDLGEGIAPDEVELQLGIRLDAEFGAVLAKTKAGAQLQITLRWQRTDRPA
jgi:hypothetical protein